jgi:hypothetical protein
MTKPRRLKVPTKAQQEEQLPIELWREHQPLLIASRGRAGVLSKSEQNFLAELAMGSSPKRRRPRSRKETWSARLNIAEAVAMLEKRGVQRKR